jgi:hypothetical protein
MYAHYNDVIDLFSIPMNVAFPMQHMLLVFFNGDD